MQAKLDDFLNRTLEQLSEEAKELDRSSVRAVYDAIRSIKEEG